MIKYFLFLLSTKSLVFEGACLTGDNLLFLLFWLENDQKLNCDEAYNFEKNLISLWEKNMRFRIWLSSISQLKTTSD